MAKTEEPEGYTYRIFNLGVKVQILENGKVIYNDNNTYASEVAAEREGQEWVDYFRKIDEQRQ